MIEPDGRRWHDMGGLDPRSDLKSEDGHDFAMWEKRVDALVIIAQGAGLMTVDGLRRVLEDMGEQSFETMTYYERWVASLNQNLMEAGAYTAAELGERMAAVQARGATYGDAAGGAADA